MDTVYHGRRAELSDQFAVYESHGVLSTDRSADAETLRGELVQGVRGNGDRHERGADAVAVLQLVFLQAGHERADEPLHAGAGDLLQHRQVQLRVEERAPRLGLSGNNFGRVPVVRAARQADAARVPAPVHIHVVRVHRALVVRRHRVEPVAVLLPRRVHGGQVQRPRAPAPVQLRSTSFTRSPSGSSTTTSSRSI